jgi:hypothetical protein
LREPRIRTRVEGDSSKAINPIRYKQIIGGLLYLSTCTRPDIPFAVSRLAKLCEHPNEEHWVAVDKVLAYIKQTANYGLWLRKNLEEEMVLWTDADWANDPRQEDRSPAPSSRYGAHL